MLMILSKGCGVGVGVLLSEEGGGCNNQHKAGGEIGVRDKGGIQGGSRRWTFSSGDQEEVAAMTAAAMSSCWLQREWAVDSAMRVGGGRSRRQ